MKITSKIIGIFALFVMSFYPPPARALQESVPVSMDERIKEYVYSQDEVYIFTGHFRYQSIIDFDPTEEFVTISIGDPTSWQVVPNGSRLFIKPVAPDATTNMTIITNKRIYMFELYAEDVDDIRDEDLIFIARFNYPGTTGNSSDFINISHDDLPDYKEHPEKYNFNYTISGSRVIAPITIFDDGEFTYLEFKNINADVPAIFMVDEDGEESLINYRKKGNFIIIERVTGQYTLRDGKHTACVFNETNPLIRNPEKRKPVLGVF